jgi:hypothetical protein
VGLSRKIHSQAKRFSGLRRIRKVTVLKWFIGRSEGSGSSFKVPSSTFICYLLFAICYPAFLANRALNPFFDARIFVRNAGQNCIPFRENSISCALSSCVISRLLRGATGAGSTVAYELWFG